MRYLLIILLCIGFQAEGQIIRANPFYTVRQITVQADTLLLDSFPNAAAAYSLRKLRSAYTGNAIRVRRSGTNAEQDIGFVDNFLDTASLKTFVGAANGFVTTWYDQGDSARDAINTNASQQPRIVNAGTLERKDNIVNIVFTGSPIRLSAASLAGTISGSNKPFSAFGLSYRNAGNFVSHILHFGSTASASQRRNELLRINADSSLIQLYIADNGTLTFINDATKKINIGNRFLFSSLSSGLAQSIYKNATLEVSGTLTPGTITLNTATIGARQGSSSFSEYLNGGMQEVIFYNSDQSTNRTSIENNINRNWLIY
jgi:hypothetical protein